jgi:hypothetical protein
MRVHMPLARDNACPSAQTPKATSTSTRMRSRKAWRSRTRRTEASTASGPCARWACARAGTPATGEQSQSSGTRRRSSRSPSRAMTPSWKRASLFAARADFASPPPRRATVREVHTRSRAAAKLLRRRTLRSYAASPSRWRCLSLWRRAAPLKR